MPCYFSWSFFVNQYCKPQHLNLAKPNLRNDIEMNIHWKGGLLNDLWMECDERAFASSTLSTNTLIQKGFFEK